jgi:hypothetical protein
MKLDLEANLSVGTYLLIVQSELDCLAKVTNIYQAEKDCTYGNNEHLITRCNERLGRESWWRQISTMSSPASCSFKI